MNLKFFEEKLEDFRKSITETFEKTKLQNINLINEITKNKIIRKIDDFSEYLNIFIKNSDDVLEMIQENESLSNQVMEQKKICLEKEKEIIEQAQFIENLLNEVDESMKKIKYSIKNTLLT